MPKSDSDVNQTEAAYDRLRRAILLLELLPGEAVSERYLEEFAQSSRTPIRAALTRLEGEGLVKRGGRGYVIAPLDAEELAQAYAFRELLECAAIREACARATPEDIARLTALVSASAGSTAEAEPRAEFASAFHLEFARIAGNPFILRALESTLRLVHRARWLEIQNDTADAGAREHAELVAFVAARRPEHAAAAMARHIAHSRDRLLAALGAQRLSLRARGLRIVA